MEKIEWDNDDTLMLIREYAKHPLLWNTRDKWHFNKIKKFNAWYSIAKACNVNIDDARKKMQSLQGSFRRERAKGKIIVGIGKEAKEVYKSKWFAFKHLLFLLDEPNEPTNNTEKIRNDIEDVSVGIESPEYALYEALNSNIKNTDNWNQHINKEIDRFENVEDIENRLKALKTVTPNPQKNVKNHREEVHSSYQTRPPEDPTMIYASHLTNKLKQFEGRTRSYLEHAINQLVFEAEMGMYDNIPSGTYPPANPNFMNGSLTVEDE
ncbi:PREDICTED: uncharacterized protein LOC108561092 isoform X2 [Nicrophorus vespilloides]|nr:PREDICTED: uncharacterized protein LOC108561092 isoform X2 [Nicrophorus vespilloides]